MVQNLVVNPNVKLSVQRHAGQITMMRLVAPVHGRSLNVVTLSSGTDNESFDALARFVESRAKDVCAIEPGDIENLESLGVLIDAAATSQAVRFSLPVSTPTVRGPRNSFDAVIATDSLCVDTAPTGLESHPHVQQLVDDAFVHVWNVKDGPPIPYAPDAAALEALRQLVRNPSRPVNLPSATARVLAASGLAMYANARPKRRDDALAVAAAAFLKDRVCTVRVLPRAACLAVADYFRKLIDEGWIEFGDWQSARYISHNEPIARLVHHWFTPFVSQIVGTAVKPSFCYFGGYRNETALPAHLDREQLEYTVSVMLRYTINGIPQRCAAWPLIVEKMDGERLELYQRCGDGAVFWGRTLRHGRKSLAAGHECDAVFLGYVNSDFEGALN